MDVAVARAQHCVTVGGEVEGPEETAVNHVP